MVGNEQSISFESTNYPLNHAIKQLLNLRLIWGWNPMKFCLVRLTDGVNTIKYDHMQVNIQI